MRGSELIEALKGSFKSQTHRELAKRLGGSASVYKVIEGLETVSAKRICGLLHRAQEAIAREWIAEIVEFYQIDKFKSTGGKKWELLDLRNDSHKALIEQLTNNIGIYFYYDSMGRVIYVGKTKKSLWAEMKIAFNRKNVANPIYKVRHTGGTPSEFAETQKRLRITRHVVPLHEAAAFFTAYRVEKPFVDQAETLFIRSIPNDLINARIEGQTRSSARSTRKAS